MDQMEKVDRLRERANVTYEEAKAALEANNWDLLDAMVALEKAGKTSGPEQTNYSTSYEQQKEYVRVEDKVREQQNAKPHVGRTIGDAFRRFFRICADNAFCVKKNDSLVFRIPLIVMVLILLVSWKVVLAVGIIALFFGFRYSFEGKDELKEANAFMDGAGNIAESFKEGFQRKGSGQDEES